MSLEWNILRNENTMAMTRKKPKVVLNTVVGRWFVTTAPVKAPRKAVGMRCLIAFVLILSKRM